MRTFPETILLKIFSYLRPDELTRVSRVNSVWRRVSLDWRLWQRVNLSYYNKKLRDLSLKKLINNIFPTKLLCLDLSGCNISTRTLRALRDNCPKLRTLNLQSVVFHESFPDSANVKYFPRNVTKLNLANSTGPSSVYRTISESLEVDTLECFGGGDKFLESLDASPSHHFMDFFLRQRWSLRILEFSYCERLTDYALALMTFSCRRLQALSIRRCGKLEGNFLHSLFSVSRSLRSLVLDGTGVRGELLRSMNWDTCLITELDLSWCRHLTEGDLLAVLPATKFLRYLRVCCCGYGHALSDKVLERMAQRSWNFLEALDLSYSCEITDDATREFLLKCAKLRYLRLNYCRKITPRVLENAPRLCDVYVLASFPVVKGSVIVNALPEHLGKLDKELPQTTSFRHFGLSMEMSF